MKPHPIWLPSAMVSWQHWNIPVTVSLLDEDNLIATQRSTHGHTIISVQAVPPALKVVANNNWDLLSQHVHSSNGPDGIWP